MLKSTTDRYGAIAVTIHWLTAITIILALARIFLAARVPNYRTSWILSATQPTRAQCQPPARLACRPCGGRALSSLHPPRRATLAHVVRSLMRP